MNRYFFNDNFDLHGRVALVTGAAGWLGNPMATVLAEAGAHVVLVGRRESQIKDLAVQLNEKGLVATPVACDITCSKNVRRLFQKVELEHGRLDILVNNASKAPPGPRDLNAPCDSFLYANEINVSAPWNLIQTFHPLLVSAVTLHGDASVINVASMYGKVSPVPSIYTETNQLPNPAFYGAAKAGLLQLTRWLACNLGEQGIRVNSISPGPFPQWDMPQKSPNFVNKLASRTALGRIGSREEIKGPVLFLASKASTYITGADIAVDGGWTAF